MTMAKKSARNAPVRKAVPAAAKKGGGKPAASAAGIGSRPGAGAFLDLPPAACAYESARAVILPLPLEESVSYGGGTAAGPAAIINASRQVELYDPELDAEPAMSYGIHTLPAPRVFGGTKAKGTKAILDGIAAEAGKHLAAGKFVVGLGGEHTVSLGLARAVAAGGPFAVVHIDAHADLRDSYEGNPLSHACVLRRIAELPECEGILQLGIRSTSPDQMEFLRAHAPGRGRAPVVQAWFARDMRRGAEWRREFRRAVRGKRVFFTFDVDGLDPAIVPATGTPEPDGLDWRRLMRIAEITAANAASVAAMDCVELAPIPGLHHAEFTVAKALYGMITLFAHG